MLTACSRARLQQRCSVSPVVMTILWAALLSQALLLCERAVDSDGRASEYHEEAIAWRLLPVSVVGAVRVGGPPASAGAPTTTSGASAVASAASSCVMWRQTAQCKHTGPREPQFDLSCSTVVKPSVSGYCECVGGLRTGLGDCGHRAWTCNQLCAEAVAGRGGSRCRLDADGTQTCWSGDSGKGLAGGDNTQASLSQQVQDLRRLVLSLHQRLTASEEALFRLQAEANDRCPAACMDRIAGLAGVAAGASQSELRAQSNYLVALAKQQRREHDEWVNVAATTGDGGGATAAAAAQEPRADAPLVAPSASGRQLAAMWQQLEREEKAALDAEASAAVVAGSGSGTSRARTAVAAPAASTPTRAVPPKPSNAASASAPVDIVAGAWTEDQVDAIGAAPPTPHTLSVADGEEVEASLTLSPVQRQAARAQMAAQALRLSDLGVRFASALPAPPSEPALFDKQQAVRRAFGFAWAGYKAVAFGHDTLKPVSQAPAKDFLAMGLSIVDAVDTMIIMGLPDAYEEARKWVVNDLKVDVQEDINLFELTIRVTGGLLAAYDLSGDKAFLDRAKEVGSKTLFAFDSPSGLPYGTIGLKSKRKYNPSAHKGGSTISEVGTLALELAALSHHTHMPVFLEKADKIGRVLQGLRVPDGLYPMYINPTTGELMDSAITLGARGDSLYEYLLKQWLVWGERRHERRWLRDMYDASVDGVLSVLLQRSTPSGLYYIAEQPRRAHGLLALGVHSDDSPVPGPDGDAARTRNARIMTAAEELMWSCYQFYVQHPTGLAPEIVTFTPGKDFAANRGARHSLLRPETVESLFVLWRVTGKERYRRWGWNIFKCIEKYARVVGGYSGLKDVTNRNAPKNDHQESFFLAETLKYLYLLFSDRSLISLHEFVFNTEGHPIRMFTWAQPPVPPVPIR